MSSSFKRGARFFIIMGVLVIVFAFWSLLQIPWDAIRRVSPDLEWFFIIDFIVWLSIGMTEIAVGWLIGKHIQ